MIQRQGRLLPLLIFFMGIQAHSVPTQALQPMISPRVIYGEDNRVDYYQIATPEVRDLANSTVALIRNNKLTIQGLNVDILGTPYGTTLGLCREEPFYTQETAAFCSGFLVAPDLVVTAGHCSRNFAACQDTRFVFGYHLEAQNVQPRSVASEYVYSCQELVHTVSNGRGEDFAVIRLDRIVTVATPLSYRRQGAIQVGQELAVMGYPMGLPMKLATGASVRAIQPEYLTANLDTFGGNSGSPVFNSISGEVEGILVRGERDYVMKNGCYVSYVCPDDSCRGEDATLMSRVLPYLGP